MGIDGIIGSNLIRQCNWTIDPEQNILSLHSEIDEAILDQATVLPFKPNRQYSMFVDLGFGEARVNNILVDYGSNGSVSLSRDVFSVLEAKNIIGHTFFERGVKQSGIVGEPVPLNRKITYSDSVSIQDLTLRNIKIRTGSTTSIGNGLLSGFVVTIDWKDKNLYLTKIEKSELAPSFAGFSLGTSPEKGIYVQSVIENSDAHNKGIRPNMKVLKLDTLDFEGGNDFCDYVNYESQDKIYLQLIDSLGQKRELQITKTSF